ncbi:hypothetical protein PENARI_c015G11420 [Penicillium arizonense]|uniref:Uncharacterized protein n=1 Tax=Penicillium arizonense TaxID=1835702 RepID=A0A1F5LCC6_PENAI|nr:hypothetical protein PENARI_c015G11420 [Penicillium arizonense]OGE50863.1 hypothetical protein PENARI_c015G11420 [Penicillium arizonense]
MASWWFPRPYFFQSLGLSQSTVSVRPEFLASSSFQFVNPRHHVAGTDTVSQVFPESAVAGLSDEQVLALFSRGFFGGFVFAFERTALRVGGWRLLPARYTGFKDDPSASMIWNTSELSNINLPPVGSCLFGSFKVLDKQIPLESSEKRPSYVDYGFGSDEFEFAGCHRFQITRLQPANDKPLVQLELQGFHCNPQKNQPSVGKLLEWFHYIYAKLLFANGVQSVLLR